jgi:hypothetical protein
VLGPEERLGLSLGYMRLNTNMHWSTGQFWGRRVRVNLTVQHLASTPNKLAVSMGQRIAESREKGGGADLYTLVAEKRFRAKEKTLPGKYAEKCVLTEPTSL